MIGTIAGFLGIREVFVKLGIGLMTLLAIGLAIWRIVAWYDNQLDASFKRGEESAYAKVEHRVIDISAKLTASAEQLRSKADAKDRILIADATDLRVRGPGRASCPAVIGSSSSGSEPAVASPGDPVGSVHPAGGTDLAAVPWDDFVTLVEQHDRLLIEAVTWRQDYEARKAIIAKETK
jgi:hypothetical protein